MSSFLLFILSKTLAATYRRNARQRWGYIFRAPHIESSSERGCVEDQQQCVGLFQRAAAGALTPSYSRAPVPVPALLAQDASLRSSFLARASRSSPCRAKVLLVQTPRNTPASSRVSLYVVEKTAGHVAVKIFSGVGPQSCSTTE